MPTPQRDKLPTVGYYAQVDVSDDESQTNAEIISRLRCDVNPAGIHVVVLELESASGWPFVRLSTMNRSVLRRWLNEHGYGDEEIIDAQNPQAVPRAN